MSIKTNTTNLQELLEVVNNLPEAGGVELPALTNPADEGHVLSGYEFIDETGSKKTGNIVSKSVSDLSTNGKTVIVPVGYYTEQATKDVDTATQATPTIEISSDGLIIANVEQTAGYVEAGTKAATHQLTVQTGKTVTPTTSEQTAVASGVYTTGAVTVAAMPTATQATPSISVSSDGLITANATQESGYVAAGTKSNTKQLTVQSAKTIIPSTSDQTAIEAGVYTTGAITVKGDADLVAANIVEGIEIFGKTGTAEPASALADELSTQDDLIAQLNAVLDGKAAGGSSGESSNKCILTIYGTSGDSSTTYVEVGGETYTSNAKIECENGESVKVAGYVLNKTLCMVSSNAVLHSETTLSPESHTCKIGDNSCVIFDGTTTYCIMNINPNT